MNGTLAPKSLGDILSETFTIYKRNFLRLTAIVAIVHVTAVIVSSIIGYVAGFLSRYVWHLPFINPILVFALVISIPLSFMAFVLAYGAVIHAMAEQYFNRPVNIARAYKFAWHRLRDMFWAVVLVYLTIFGIYLAAIFISIIVYGIIPPTIGEIPNLLVAFVISGTMISLAAPAAVYLGIIWQFVAQTALLEGCGPRAALSRSSALVKGSWWRVLGIMLLLTLIVQTIVGILVMIFYIPAMIDFTTWTITGAETGFPTGAILWMCMGLLIGNIIQVPILAIGETLLYFDLRVRKEGYSLDVMADELGLTSTATDTVA